MNDDMEALAAHFLDNETTFTTSPLYQELCRVAAHDEQTLALLARRRAGQQPSFLLFGAVHYLLLSDVQHPLRQWYASLAGAEARNPADVASVFTDFCEQYQRELLGIISTRLVQTNVVKRAWALRLALAAVRRECDRPVHLVEVGSSAGLLLQFDRYRYVAGGAVFGDRRSPVTLTTEWRAETPPPDLDDLPPVATRTGVDLSPVDATNPDERRWLRALVWPEDRHKMTLLTGALTMVAADPPRILTGGAVEVCPMLGGQLPAGEPRVVFHAATRMHVPEQRHAAFDDAIDSIGANGPLYHAWLEPLAAPHAGHPASDGVALHGPDGARSVELARVNGHCEWISPGPSLQRIA